MKDTIIEKATRLDPESCRRLVLSSEPWLTLGYGESDVEAIVRSSAGGNLWLAKQGETTVGFALSSPGVLLGEYLRLIAVDGSARARGVGRALMAALEEQAFQQWPNVYLCVSDFNLGARRFYQRLGYTEVGCLDDLLMSGRAEILMRKTVASWREFRGQAGGRGA